MFFYYILTIPLFFYISPILNIYSTQLIHVFTFTPLLYLLFLIIQLLHLLLSILLHSSTYCCNCTPLLHLLLSIVLHSSTYCYQLYSTYCYQLYSTPPLIVIKCTPTRKVINSTLLSIILHLLLSILLHASIYCYLNSPSLNIVKICIKLESLPKKITGVETGCVSPFLLQI